MPKQGKTPQTYAEARQLLFIQCLRGGLKLPYLSWEVPEGLDWEALLSDADAEGVFPYAYEYLTSQRSLEEVSIERRCAWERKLALYVSHFYWRRAQWENLRATFHRMGKDFLPLKGAAFAFAEGMSPYRLMSDFDILVRTRDVTMIHAYLEREGFEPCVPQTRFAGHRGLRLAQLRRGRLLREEMGRHLYRKEDILLDVHWAPNYRNYESYAEFDPEELWNEARTNEGCESLLTLPHQFLFVLVHAFQSQRVSNWLDVLLLDKRMGTEFNGLHWIRHATVIKASVETRHELIRRFRQVRWIRSVGPHTPSVGMFALGQISQPPVVSHASQGPSLGQYLGTIRDDLRWLTFSEGIRYGLGMFVPSRRYYANQPWKMALLFYRAWLGSVLNMLLRIGRAVVKFLNQ